MRNVEFFAFGKEIKRQIRMEQNNRCALCGAEVFEMEVHHKVPKNALKRGKSGIKGKDIKDNGVALCSGETGRGVGSADDCHEYADMKAIHEKKFWKDGRFVDLNEIDPNTYTISHYEMPKCRHRKKGRKRR